MAVSSTMRSTSSIRIHNLRFESDGENNDDMLLNTLVVLLLLRFIAVLFCVLLVDVVVDRVVGKILRWMVVMEEGQRVREMNGGSGRCCCPLSVVQVSAVVPMPTCRAITQP